MMYKTMYQGSAGGGKKRGKNLGPKIECIHRIRYTPIRPFPRDTIGKTFTSDRLTLREISVFLEGTDVAQHV